MCSNCREDEVIGRLIRTIVIWPIPPHYAAEAAGIVLLTVAIVAAARVHSFPGVLAAVAAASLVIAGLRALRVPGRRTG